MLWLKTFHILFVMAWLAGLFYLPRIFVHYAEGKDANEDVRRLVTMAGKLFSFATVMAVIALVLGIWLWLVWWPSAGTWMTAKLGFVVLLMAYHFQCYRYLRRVRSGQTIPGSIFFRIFNESSLIIVIPILIMVVVKPFQ